MGELEMAATEVFMDDPIVFYEQAVGMRGLKLDMVNQRVANDARRAGNQILCPFDPPEPGMTHRVESLQVEELAVQAWADIRLDKAEENGLLTSSIRRAIEAFSFGAP